MDNLIISFIRRLFQTSRSVYDEIPLPPSLPPPSRKYTSPYVFKRPTFIIEVEDDECIICSTTSTMYEWVQLNNCCHIYHQRCITEWLDVCQKPSCPLCRSQVDKIPLQSFLENHLRCISTDKFEAGSAYMMESTFYVYQYLEYVNGWPPCWQVVRCHGTIWNSEDRVNWIRQN